MRILVTGASGFIGRWVVAALSQSDAEVWATSRCPSAIPETQGLHWVAADILNTGDIEKLIENVRPNVLIHCAWETTPGKYWEADANLRWVSATLALVQAFEKCGGSRVVVAGTCAEYHWGQDDLQEGKNEFPSSLYGSCKNSTRMILERWCSLKNVSIAWCRVFCPFGIGESKERLVPKIVLKLLAGETVQFDSGRSILDFISVEDLGEAFKAVTESDSDGAINLASGHGRSIRSVVSEIARCLGRENQIVFDSFPDRQNEPDRIVASTEKLRTEVKWQAAVGFEQRIAETCEWWARAQ